MKKNILKYFYVYLIVFLLFGIIYSLIVEFFLSNKIKTEIKNIQEIVIKNKKEELKNDLENIKKVFYFIKDTIYSTSNEELLKLVNIPIKWDMKKLYISRDFIYGLIDRKIDYSVSKNYIFANLNNIKYLVALKNRGKLIYIFGVNKKFLDNIIIYNFLKYLDNYNKGKISYVAVGKVTTLNPDKSGVFGYVYYMPDKFKHLEGNLLSTKRPDFKGNYYRAKYFECFKKNKPCFIKYYFKNPETGKVEEKISYFTFIKDYNFILAKGIYASQIKSAFSKEVDEKINSIKNLVYTFLIIFFIVYLLFLGFLYILLNKAKNSLLRDYEKLEKELINRLYFDKLTKLPNRNKLLEDLNSAKAIVILDIKDFSEINDIYGFEIGDKILKLVSHNLKSFYKNVYRIGSDEFAILFDKKIDEEVLKKVSNLRVTFYNIVVDFVIGGSNCEERLLESSELALKEAYRLRKYYMLYDENMLKIQTQRIEKIRLLREVLEKEAIIPYYHCIVDNNKEVVKYEALMRIKIKDEIVSPFFFMDLIKEARLYVPFSQIMIKKVFEDLEKIDKKVSINLSFEDIANEEMKRFILSLINKDNAKKIVFEILESESIKDYELIKGFIDEVKEKGVEIAIDDFGSGYSNFVNIMKLNPDIIKIDSSLVKTIDNEKNYKLIELIVTFAKEFGLRIVAEFVSDEEKYKKLKKIGVDEYQGFYFCEPKPLEKIVKESKISSKKGHNENRN